MKTISKSNNINQNNKPTDTHVKFECGGKSMIFLKFYSKILYRNDFCSRKKI